MKNDFWRSWKNKTEIEKKAIKSVERAREIIVNSVPKSKLVAIYIKGSFVRREMKEGSDVDIVPVVTENKYENAVFGTNIPEVHPPCMIVPLSLWEFKHNKLFTKAENKPDTRAKPDRFLKRLKYFKLIWGRPLSLKGFKIRNDKKAIDDHLKYMLEVLIPRYENKNASLKWIIKEFFWLTENELELKGIKVKHSFKGIANAVKDKEHPIKEAYEFRIKSIHNPKKGRKFVERLKENLKEMRIRSRK